jgi:hypothetical protein
MLNQINVIAPNLKWDEKDENDRYADSILGARLRAKFYGARVITYRDFVLKILQRSFDAQDRQDPNNPTRSFTAVSSPDTEIDSIIVQYAEQGIKALVKSTSAFHGLGDPGIKRLMVTNIWGTAHAYVIWTSPNLKIVTMLT